MTKYIINNTEVSRDTYFDILNDLIDLAKDGMPLEIQFTPIPASPGDVNKLWQSIYVKTDNALEFVNSPEPNNTSFKIIAF
jgi:hypothetical protein